MYVADLGGESLDQYTHKLLMSGRYEILVVRICSDSIQAL